MRKILVKANLGNLNGLSFHRLIVPYAKVSDMENFKVDVFQDLNILNDEQLKEYHAVVYQREIDINGNSLEIINRYKRLGLKVIFDIDDYWHLPSSHYLYKAYKAYHIPQQTEIILNQVDVITTTTKHLANKIKTHNSNVHVIPNCLDIEDKQWKPNKTKSELTRFGYVAGVYHMEDVRLLEMPIRKVFRNNIKASFTLGGWTDNDHYKEYERILSFDNKLPYKRVEALPVYEYGNAYNDTDVSLVPLVENQFSECKSEIKLIEAAAHGNPAIVSDVKPYNIFPKDTAIFCNNSDVNKWYKVIKQMAESSAMREDYALKLKEYVNENYNLKKWTQLRKDLLASVLA